MTMNMTPPYQMQHSYQNSPYHLHNAYSLTGNMAPQINPMPPQNTIRPIPPNQINSNSRTNFNPNQSYQKINPMSQTNIPRTEQSFNPSLNVQRQNSFMRPSQGPQQRYMSPIGQSYNPQEIYSQPNYQQQSYQNYYPAQGPAYQQLVPQTSFYQQPVSNPYLYQNFAQNYVPLYTSPNPNYQFQMVGQQRRNIPQKSINSNFSYENANFDCDYSVEENLVHCVICNQTYKANQRKQHLQLHREKARNVNIRPVDQQQLKRLQKYNSMIKTGLIVKPIVEPDEFNVQYNPNQFVLRKVTQYKDVDAPYKNTIEIQTDDPHNFKYSRPQDLGFNEPIRSGNSSPDRRNQSIRRSQNPVVIQNPRNTNTRFNSESIRQEQRIFLSDRFDHHQIQGETFNNSRYDGNKSLREGENNSLRESERRSNSNKLGHEESASMKYRNAESVEHPEDLGYEKSSNLHDIYEADEEYRQTKNDEIPFENIVHEVNRESSY